MTSELKTLKIVAALSKLTLDTRDELLHIVEEINRESAEKNCATRYEIIAWCEERSAAGEETEWSKHFHCENPVHLIEQIRQKYQTDLILCVFWGLFGSENFYSEAEVEGQFEQAARKSMLALREWVKTGHPLVKIFICNRKAPFKSENEKTNRFFVSNFRTALAEQQGEFWWSYERKSLENNSELRKLVHKELWKNIEPSTDEQKTTYEPLPPLNLTLPNGWVYLTPQNMLQMRNDYLLAGQKLSPEDSADFFDGKEPSFEIALSSSIPRRQTVGKLREKINNAAEEKKLHITLLAGPGGEGKSTILYQLAVDLIEQRTPRFHIIFREDSTAGVNISLINELLQYRSGNGRVAHNFIIVSDNAHTVAKDVFECTKRISRQRISQNNIQFLLASRGTDWRWQHAPSNFQWEREIGKSHFHRVTVRELNLADAEEIVMAWEASDALGTLADYPAEERAHRFWSLARDEASKDENTSSFFGAILNARKNRTLEGYVEEEILGRLKKRTALDGKSLEHYFAYVVALHADGFPYLTTAILQRALNCTGDQLNDEILEPLADEAAIQTAEKFVLTRHHVIAEYARRILENKSRGRFQKIIAELGVAANQGFEERPRVVSGAEIKLWRKLPRQYFERGEKDLAIYLAEALADAEPNHPIPVCFWTNLLRESAKLLKENAKLLRKNKKEREAVEKEKEAVEEISKAINVFRVRYKSIEADKGYFTEWSVCEGQNDNYFFSVCLVAVALSDQSKEREDRHEPPMMRLSHLSNIFSRLFLKTSDESDRAFHNPNHAEVFGKATIAAVELGLSERAKPSYNTDYNVSESVTNLKNARSRLDGKIDLATTDLRECFTFLLNGVKLASELSDLEREELPKSPQPFKHLTFSRLMAILGIKTVVKLSEESEIKSFIRPREE